MALRLSLLQLLQPLAFAAHASRCLPARATRRHLAIAAASSPDLCHDRVLVVDGCNMAYRMHFALPPMSTAAGEPTHVVQGFCNALLRLEEQFPGHNQLVVFDTPGPTTRTALDATYKAQRSPMPRPLSLQMPILREACLAFGVPVIAVPGVEADDVIATCVAAAQAAARPGVVVVSSDKDMLQLVSPPGAATNVTVWCDRRKQLYDHAAVAEKHGVGPELLGDMLALVGDSSDNVPGVPGVGAKGAAKLLQQHGSLEAVLAAAPSMKASKRATALVEHADVARHAKQMVTLQADVPLDAADSAAIGGAARRPITELPELRGFLQRYELRQLERRVLSRARPHR